jgi:hypothetical protein
MQWLDEFDIFLTSRSDRVYNNGRQQVEVTLVVRPAENHALTDEQFDSLGLVYQNSQGEWVTLATSSGDAPWFSQAEQDLRFDYYPSLDDRAVPLKLPMDQHAIRFKRLYVHSCAAPGDSLILAGAISYSPHDSPCLTDTSTVTLMAEQSPSYCFPEDYQWQRRVRVEDRSFDSAAITSDAFVYEYTLRPQRVDFSCARLPDAYNLIRWDEDHPSRDLATVVGVALPHASDVTYAPSLASATELQTRLAKQTMASTHGQLVVIAQGLSNVPRALHEAQTSPSLKLEALDRHGVLHRLALDFETPEERFEVRVRHETPVQPQAISNIRYFKVDGRGLPQDGTHCRLYNNGHQQTYVQVHLEAVDEQGVIVPVPKAVLDMITLVDYNTGAQLGSGYQVSQHQSAKDKRFSYYQNQPSVADSPPIETHAQTVTFYISTTTRENKRIAARLEYGGRRYHTHAPDLPAGNGTTVAGRTNCSAMIEPKEQDYVYKGPAYFRFSRVDASDTKADGVEDIDRYELRLNAALPHTLCWFDRNTTLAWDYVGDTRSNWIYRGALTGSTSITARHRDIAQPLALKDDAVCYFRIKVKKNWSDGETDVDIGYRCTPLDENGNAHSVWVNTVERMNLLRLS